MLSSPFSLPASLPSRATQFSQLSNDPPSNENTNYLDRCIGTRYPSDAHHRFIPIDQPATRPSDNIMSLLESSVSTADYFRNNPTANDQKDGKGSCDTLSCNYGDLYDADDELLEEDHDAEDHDIYFEDPGQIFSLLPDILSGNMGAHPSPLLVGDILPLGGPISSGISPTPSQIPSRGCPTQFADSLPASNPPSVLPWIGPGLSPFLFAIPSPTRANSPPTLDLANPTDNNAPLHSPQLPPSPSPSSPLSTGATPITPTATPTTTPTHTPTSLMITTPTYTPTTPAETSTLNAWFDLPSPTISSTASPTSAWYASSPWYTTTNTTTTSSHIPDDADEVRTYYSDDSFYDEWEWSSASSLEDDDEDGGWRGFSGYEVATAVVVVEMELDGLEEGEWRGLMLGGDTDGDTNRDTDTDTKGEGSGSGESEGSSGGGSESGSGESDGWD